MTEKLAEISRPKAEKFKTGRKIYLVPTFFVGSMVPEDLKVIVDRYWTDVRNQVENLENTLTKVTHVYHESVFDSGEEGLKQIEEVNPHAHAFISTLYRSTASLEATDHKEALKESIDWQRCISIGLTSSTVRTTAGEALETASKTRYNHMSELIDETLRPDEAGLFIVSETHQVQFPSDIQVFYIAPPSLDELKRWVNEQMRKIISEREAGKGSEPDSTSELQNGSNSVDDKDTQENADYPY